MPHAFLCRNKCKSVHVKELHLERSYNWLRVTNKLKESLNVFIWVLHARGVQGLSKATLC